MHDKFFADSKKASKFLEMLSFQHFEDTADAVSAATSCIEGKVSKSLAKFLKKKTKKLDGGFELAVADKSLAVSLKESGLKDLVVVHNDKTQELFRGIRTHIDELLLSDSGSGDGAASLSSKDMRAMQLGLSHSLSRYKLKFSADKVDTMIIQAVGLLDELDKEINNYAMRVKEWYGWHFPELQALVADNVHYSKLVLSCGMRVDFKNTDMSAIFDDGGNTEAIVKEAAELSMGTEIADVDIIHIQHLADQVIHLTEYRSNLFEYLKNRMNAIAPNLTIMVGELVGARLISHAGSLMNLAKQPASTVQILGAEKALFRALKTKSDTPKYGLIYHASLIGQASPKNKGKISRVLAAKASLAIRVDALSDETSTDADGNLDTTIGFEGRAKVEARLRQLETGFSGGSSNFNPKGALTSAKTAKYDPVAAKTMAQSADYNQSSDMVLDNETPSKKAKKEKKEKKKRKSLEKSEERSSKKRKVEESDEDSDDKMTKEEKKKQKKEKKKLKKEKRKSS